jgi:hypothetical protein
VVDVYQEWSGPVMCLNSYIIKILGEIEQAHTNYKLELVHVKLNQYIIIIIIIIEY